MMFKISIAGCLFIFSVNFVSNLIRDDINSISSYDLLSIYFNLFTECIKDHQLSR